MSQSRQLAAIMFTDIVGYTALMGKDEHKAFALLNKNRQLQKSFIEAFSGRWIKEIGDGVMASFTTVSDAVHAAIKIQETCKAANDFQLRIGIHQGEVVFENDDVFGDSVNIAARVQAASPPGCIFISETVHHNISNKSEIKSRFVKEEKLKNVSQPVRMYQVLFAGSEIIEVEKLAVPTIEKSIAVLPFVNMSNDADQEYFSDGISEEIINVLAQVPGIKVIGRTSSFAFKGKNIDLKVIGQQLNVTHLLEGSVRKSGNKLRVTAQLISVTDGFHLYSEKFDRELEDVFAIQDEIALSILEAIKIKLLGAQKESLVRRYTDNVEAYELYLKGRFHYNRFTPDDLKKGVSYFEKAINLQPDYAIAYAGISSCYINMWAFNFLLPDQSIPPMLAAAQNALHYDDQIADSYYAMGRVKLHYDWKYNEAVTNFEKAISLNPNSADCHIQLGFCAAFKNDYKKAMEHAVIAESLDPYSLMNLWYVGVVIWMIGDFEKFLAKAKRLIDLEPHFFGGHMWAGLANILLGNHKQGIYHMELTVQLNPGIMGLWVLGQSYGMGGDKLKAREVLEKMITYEGIEFHKGYVGQVYASIGELDEAFSYFDKATDQKENDMLFIRWHLRDFKLLKEDPRTEKLLKRIGMPY